MSKLPSGLLILACCGCGGDGQSGLDAATGGTSSSVLSANGGRVWGGAVVNPAPQVGGRSTVSTGGTSGASGCPVWPASKLHPLIGPQFYGPDPGPCSIETVYLADSRVETSILDYSPDGSISTIRRDVATATMVYDAEGRPTSMTDPVDGVTTYEYGDEFVLRTDPTHQLSRYNLDSLGYVTTSVVTDTTNGTEKGIYTYSYKDCRISRVTYQPSGGGAAAEIVYYSDVVYDGEGRMIRRSGSVFTSTFDYSCWR